MVLNVENEYKKGEKLRTICKVEKESVQLKEKGHEAPMERGKKNGSPGDKRQRKRNKTSYRKKQQQKKSIEGEEGRRHGDNNMERDYSTLYRKSVRTYIAFKRKGFSGSGSEKDCMKCQSWE